MYPFVLNVSIKLQRIIAHIVVEVYGSKSFAKFLQLGYVFFKTGRVWELQKEILNEKFRPLWTKIGFFFLLRFRSTKQAAIYQDRLQVFQPRVIHSFNQNRHSFPQSNHYTCTSVSTKLFQGIKDSASFDLSITAPVLILDTSSLTRLFRKLSCHANRGELTICTYFGPCSHATKTRGFV